MLTVLAGLFTFGAFLAAAASDRPAPERRASADAAFKKGNFKDAFAVYQSLAVDPADEADKVSHDLTQGITCLMRLGRSDEMDDFREKVIAAHAHNWRLLQAAAQTYYSGNENYGYIVAGQFYRGNHPPHDGRQVYTAERDRIRALQLMQQAIESIDNEPNKEERGNFYFALSGMLLDGRHGGGAWQLQYLSDLSKLPDYEDDLPRYYYGGDANRGAPVNEDGTPVFHTIPKSWKDAATDGQRWRWCLLQVAEMSPWWREQGGLHFCRVFARAV